MERYMEFRTTVRLSSVMQEPPFKLNRLGDVDKLDLFLQSSFPHGMYDTVVIVIKKDGKKFVSPVSEYVSRAHTNLPRQRRSSTRDYYITRNTFKSLKSRPCLEDLQALNNIVIDIDCHGYMSVTNYQNKLGKLVYKLDQCVSEGRLPEYNYLVETGRGLQVWWGIRSCCASKKNISIYRSVSAYFCHVLKELADAPFSVDTSASCSPAGLVRFPGTHNQKGFHKKVVFTLRQFSHMDMHKFFDAHKEEICALFPARRIAAGSTEKERNLALAWSRLDGLIRVIKHRDSPAGQELRDLNLFCAFCFFSRLMDHEKIYEDVLEKVNRCFKKPMPEREYRRYLSTASRKSCIITDDKVAELLDFNQEERELFGSRKKKRTGLKRAVKEPCRYKGRDRDIVKYIKAGMTDTECARKIGCSRTTVANVRKKRGLAGWGRRVRRIVRGLAMAGCKYTRIAARAGCSMATVYNILREMRLRMSMRKKPFIIPPSQFYTIGRAYAGAAFDWMDKEKKKDAYAEGFAAGYRLSGGVAVNICAPA